MSAPSIDDPRARLNYFNGQRLAASDLRTEQAHHLGMRRVLNRSLYSPGVVTGLQVEPEKPDPANPADKGWKHRVVVRRGLAFDHLGREIFLPQDMSVQVRGAPSTTPGEVFGNLLAISYREQRRQPVRAGCTLPPGEVLGSGGGACCAACRPATESGTSLAWGAPMRIVSDVVFEFLDAWPTDDSGRVVLGQIELDKGCVVVRVGQGVRRYAQPVKPQVVRAISLEGEKDIAVGNSKLLHFHIDGGFPESATLYLRARPFNTLYYTELGQHTHAIHFDSRGGGKAAAHVHPIDLSNLALSEAGGHRHEIHAQADDSQVGALEFGSPGDGNAYLITGPGGVSGGRGHVEVSLEGKHTHPVVAGSVPAQTGDGGALPDHVHPVVGTTQATGLLPAARQGPPLNFVDDLRVLLDGHDVTALIRSQIESQPNQLGLWPKLGDGTSNHPLARPEGTGPIDLLQLGLELGLGTHTLEFRVLAAHVGGNLQYNLYVG